MFSFTHLWKRCLLCGFVFAVVSLSEENSASAQISAGSQCSPFFAGTQGRQPGSVDLGEKGSSLGDIRVNSHELVGEDGQTIGKQFVSSSLVSKDQDSEVDLVTIVYELPAGRLVSTGLVRRGTQEFIDPSSRADVPDFTIVGGAGVFRGAHGTVGHSGVMSDGTRRLTFDVSCE